MTPNAMAVLGGSSDFKENDCVLKYTWHIWTQLYEAFICEQVQITNYIID